MMFRIMTGFSTAMLRSLAKPWWAWLGALVAANMVAPLFFIETLEAKVVLVTFMLAAGLQMILFKLFGFVKLLGVGHLPWLPLVIWLATRLPQIGTDTSFGRWLLILIVLNGISLVIDFIDVGRYLAGDRTPTFTLETV
jgi:hypothetical protein